jgi:hypothetical protein
MDQLNRLPSTQDVTLAYVFSLVVALLMGVASVIGLLYPADIYPSEELLQSFVPNDVVNLVIGLPILLGAMGLARHGRLIGMLFWPGALFYILYNYVIYLFAMPLNGVYLLYLALVASSLCTMIGLVASIDSEAVQRRLAGVVPERAAGGILAAFGVLFLLRAIAVIGGALISQTPIPAAERATLITDLLITPAWIVGGVLLWRRRALGYAVGTGLLYQASMLFIGLIVFMLLQPLLTDAPFMVVDTVVVSIMGLIFFVPFGLFIRGIVSNRRP